MMAPSGGKIAPKMDGPRVFGVPRLPARQAGPPVAAQIVAQPSRQALPR
jgi:hypothetical protein